jgi:hypothetical protein
MTKLYLSKTRRIHRLHLVFAAKVDVVEVDDVSRDADALGELVVPLEPAERRGRRVRLQSEAGSVSASTSSAAASSATGAEDSGCSRRRG